MKIEIRSDSVVIDGYVNAVGRDSRPILTGSELFHGKCVEQVRPGTFRRSLEKRENVELLLNHNKNRHIGSTESGELTLAEDNIGLKAHAVVTDAEVIEKARGGKISGWSFGMFVKKEEKEERAEGIPRRILTDIDMFEVSLIDDTMIPCYAGTSVECRAEGENMNNIVYETRTQEDRAEIINTENFQMRFEKLKAGYLSDMRKRHFEERTLYLKELDRDIDILGYDLAKKLYDRRIWEAEQKYLKAELRFNPNHGKDGKFTSGNGLTSGGKGVKMTYKERKRVSSQIATDFPNLKADGKEYNYITRNHFYQFKVKEFGLYHFTNKMEINGNEDKIKKHKKGR